MTFTELKEYMRTHYYGAMCIGAMCMEWYGKIYVFENRNQRFLTMLKWSGECQVYTYHETIGKKESGQ